MISVCMCSYNGEKYIYEQINSILNQLDVNDELIISDDSSTDSTVSIVNSFKDNRIKLLENNEFHSPIFNLENALKHARGDYIFLCDQDDIWMSNKVSSILPLFNQYNCIVSDAEVIDQNENVIYKSFFSIRNCRPGFFHNLKRNGYIGCCMAIDRKILSEALPFPKYIPMHDSWIGLIAEVYGKTYFLNEPLVKYRRHGGNVSQLSNSRSSFKKRIFQRVMIVFGILIRKFCGGKR